MTTMLRLKDGKREIVSRDRHFIDLLRAYMGDDAAEFYEERIKSILDTINEVENYINLKGDREDFDDTLHRILSEVRHE